MLESIISVIVNDILKEPPFFVGIITMIGLISLKKKPDEILIGFMKPALGFIMLSAGAGIVVAELEPLSIMLKEGFNIQGITQNTEAVTSMAQKVLAVETMYILFFGYIVNMVIAYFTRFKYIFLTVHISFFMSAMLAIILSDSGLSRVEVVVLGACILGAWSAISPAIGQHYTSKVTGNKGEIAMGHFGSLGFYLSAFIGELIGDTTHTTENVKIPKYLSFLNDTTTSTALVMAIFYLVVAIASGQEFVESTLSNGQNFIVFAILGAFTFAIGVTIVGYGANMMVSELVPAFKGISSKLIPNSVPAVDCTIFFKYAPMAVVIGFVGSLAGGLVAMTLISVSMGIFVIPGISFHFFCGATAGVFGNATGGIRGAIVGSFTQGLLSTFGSVWLIDALSSIDTMNTVFSDFDFGVIGVSLYNMTQFFGSNGAYMLVGGLLLVLVLLSIGKHKYPTINFHEK